MPSGRKRKENEFGFDYFAGAVRAKEAMYQKEFTATALCGLHFADFASVEQFEMSQAFERTDGGMNGGVGCAVRPPAIPTTVGHLLLEEVADNGVEAGIFVLEVREDGEDHAGDARLARVCPLRPGAEADAAVALKAFIEK